MMTPHFTLFVDAVFQMMDQYPAAFEFNLAYVFRIFEHSSSCQFGTVTSAWAKMPGGQYVPGARRQRLTRERK